MPVAADVVGVQKRPAACNPRGTPRRGRGTTSDRVTLGGLLARGKLGQTGMRWWVHVQVRAAEDAVQLAMGVGPHPAGERTAAPQTAPG